jgi:signal transduction histidine kinase
MNDFSPSFDATDVRPRRRLALAASARASAGGRPSPRPGAVAVQAAASHAQACARGELACRAAWLHVRTLGVDGVLALGRDAGVCAAGDGAAIPSLAAIAAEVEHVLAHGLRAGSARALLLLAVLADARFDGLGSARAVADAAVALADAGPERDAVRRLHAALVLARDTPFEACLHAYGPAPGADQGPAVSLWTGLRFAGGVALPEILHGLEQATGAEPCEEAVAGVAVLRALVLPQARAPRLGCTLAGATSASFCTWTLRLQLAWFGGDRVAACRAALAAAPLAGPLAAPVDLLNFHLFGVLALAWDAAPSHHHALQWHRGELAAAAVRCGVNAGAMAALAGAVALASEGDVPGALRGYEAAAATAAVHGQTWVAALAWELAAALCQQCAFGTAVPAYRRRALMAWHACGAHGRIARLCQTWQHDSEPAPPAQDQYGAPGPGWPCAGLQDQQDEQRRVARAGTVGELGVTIAHEVNQPLAAILLQAAAARRWLRRPRPDLDKALEAIEQIAVSGRRAGDIVRSVQGLARRHSTGLTVFAVDAALEEVLRLLSGALRRHGVQVELALQLPGCRIHANRAQVQQVVINLLMNAIDALGPVADRERQVVLASGRLDADTIDISVADNGPGVSPLDRDHIFDALFSTKAHGTGVGLSISRAIAEAHGGQIAYRPRSPYGALFSLLLPADIPAEEAGDTVPLAGDRQSPGR